jgi:hypothetical protein
MLINNNNQDASGQVSGAATAKKAEKTGFVERISKNDAALKIIAAVGILIIAVIFISDFAGFSLFSSGGKADSAYAAEIETRLKTIIEDIGGVGEVSVMVTLSGSGDPPAVRGAAVVCEGGEDPIVRQKVIETVSKVLGISTAKVSVTY